jgi:rare lipoprotein A
MWMRDSMRSMNAGLDWGRGLVLLGLFLFGCATAQHTGKRGLPETRGEASYYAEKFVGRTTANGEIFDQEVLTAAHRSLPFGTRVRVTRIDRFDKPSVVVRINDRGPFKRGRIIDLSKKAARRLQMIRDGVAEVKLEIVSYPAGAKPVAADSAAVDSAGTDAPKVAW